MTGHEYEYVVAEYLKNNGYKKIEVTKGSGDYGVDVVARKGIKKYAVQCKYYHYPVSLGAVQEAVAGKAMYECNSAMVITNSTFTKAAEELAAKNGVVLIPNIASAGRRPKKHFSLFGIIAGVVLATAALGIGIFMLTHGL